MAESYNSQSDRQFENTYGAAEAQNKSVWENIKSKVTEFLNNIKEGIKTVFQDVREYTGALVYRASTGKEEREMLLKEDILKDRKAQEKQEELDKQAKEDLDKILKGTEEKSEPEKQSEKEKQEPERKSMAELVAEVQNTSNSLDVRIADAEKRLDAIQHHSVYSSDEAQRKDLLGLEKQVDDLKKEMGEFTQQDKDKLPDDIKTLNEQLDKVYEDVHEATKDISQEERDNFKEEREACLE